MEDLKAENERLRARLQDADQRLLQNAHHIRDAGERITRLESVGTAMAKRLGPAHYLVKEWEKLTGGKVGE